MYKGVLTKGVKLSVRFQASPSSPELAVVTMHWTPDNQNAAALADSIALVVPGKLETLFDDNTPVAAQLLVIDVDVAEPGGRGDLEVVSGTETFVGHIEGDLSWVFSVQ
jgi:hypothetical protein